MKITDHSQLQIHGRVPFNHNGEAELWWSFAGFSFRFHGTGFSLSAAFTDEQPGHLAFIIDGITHKRAINGEKTFTFTVKDGEHTVFVRRASNRAASGAVLLTDFSLCECSESWLFFVVEKRIKRCFLWVFTFFLLCYTFFETRCCKW